MPARPERIAAGYFREWRWRFAAFSPSSLAVSAHLALLFEIPRSPDWK
jgi:hypothetical protein